MLPLREGAIKVIFSGREFVPTCSRQHTAQTMSEADAEEECL